MVDIIITTINGVDYATLQNASLDLAFGSDQNDFELSFTDEIDESLFGNGSRMYLDGTEYGGIVDKVTSDIETGMPFLTYAGRTWHGVLEKKILTPDTGQDYLKVSGSVSSVLTALISRVRLGELFTVAPNTTQISYQFDRYVTAYTGIRSMLAANNLKLMMTSNQHGVIFSVTPVTDMGKQADSDQLDFTLERDYRPVNHLIGLGKGELRNRAVTHWYANSNGVVSQKQSLTGADEIAATYDYSNAELAELNENTQKKLKELQSQGSLDIQLRDTEETYYVGDVLTGRDNNTGLTVSATVTKKIVKVTDGLLTVDYEVGKSSTSTTSLSGSSESDSGGHAYYAGEGLNLTNYTFTAEVTQSELDSVSSDAAAAVRQVSDLAADVGAAQQTADAAVVSASSAQSTANTAVSKANAAQYTADSAVSAAGVAQTTAEAAQTAANLAIQNAQELVVNGGFETGDLTGWMARNATGIGVTAVANETHSGKYMLSGNLPTSPNAIEFLSKPFPVVQGRILRCSGWFWNDAGARVANICIQFNDGSMFDKTDIASLGNGWQYASSDVTVPAGVSSGQFRLAYWNPDSSTVFTRSDDLSVKDITESAAAQAKADAAEKMASTAVQTVTAAAPLKATKTGTTVVLTATTATTSAAGSMSAADKAKLDGIDEGANAYTLPAANTSTLGGVKPDGRTITVSSDGTLTASVSGAAVSFIAAWPVGSIYHSTQATNPGYVYGGTWRSLPSTGGYLWERLA